MADRLLPFSVQDFLVALQGLEADHRLSSRYIWIVSELYGLGRPPRRMSEVAEQLGVSSPRVSQIRDIVVERCRVWLERKAA